MNQTSLCDTGRIQSPVRIKPKSTTFTNYSPFVFSQSYRVSTTLKLTYLKGSTIVFTAEPGSSGPLQVTGGVFKGTFTFQSAHLHWPRSKHRFPEKNYVAEAHFIHKNLVTGEIGVFGFFFVETSTEDTANTWNRLLSADANSSFTLTDGLSSLMQGDLTKFYHYLGSLTVPPCTEGLLWIVVPSSIPLAKTRLERLQTEIVTQNYRETQPLNGRVVQRSYEWSWSTIRLTDMNFSSVHILIESLLWKWNKNHRNGYEFEDDRAVRVISYCVWKTCGPSSQELQAHFYGEPLWKGSGNETNRECRSSGQFDSKAKENSWKHCALG